MNDCGPPFSLPIGTIDNCGRVWDGIVWRCPVGIPEAPRDGFDYGRRNETWVRVVDYLNGEAVNLTVDNQFTATNNGFINNFSCNTATVSGNATVQGALTVVQIIGDQGTLDVDGAANFAQGVAIDGGLSCTLSAYFGAAVNMAELQVSGDGLIAGTTHTANISVTGAAPITAEFAGNVNIIGTLTVGGQPVTGTTPAIAELQHEVSALRAEVRRNHGDRKSRRT